MFNFMVSTSPDDISQKLHGTYIICSRHPLIETVLLRVSRFSVEISRTYPHAVTHDRTQTETLLG